LFKKNYTHIYIYIYIYIIFLKTKLYIYILGLPRLNNNVEFLDCTWSCITYTYDENGRPWSKIEIIMFWHVYSCGLVGFPCGIVVGLNRIHLMWCLALNWVKVLIPYSHWSWTTPFSNSWIIINLDRQISGPHYRTVTLANLSSFPFATRRFNIQSNAMT